MNWKLKARVQRLVATLPRSDEIYYALQRTVGTLRRGGPRPFDWFEAAGGMIGWFAAAGRGLRGKRVFELGTGRNLNLPIALWLAGAERVVTADLNDYLSEPFVLNGVDYVRRHHEEVRRLLGTGADTPDFGGRLQRLAEFRGRLPDLLRLINATYLTRVDAAHLACPAGSFDLHVSHTVLEHVQPEKITAILVEAGRIMAPDGLLMHSIDPSDHFAHSDGSITSVNFLQFSDDEWNRWAGNKFAYHNRLRGYQYVNLFERAGLEVLRTHRVVDERAAALLKAGFPVDRRFQNLAPVDLAVSWFMIMAAVAAPPHRPRGTRAPSP
jgi:SAM-dependent methyltransferase